MKTTSSRIWLAVLATGLAITQVYAGGSVEPAPNDGAGLTDVELLVETGDRIVDVGTTATGFTAHRNGDLTVVTVTRPWQGATGDDVLRYVLYPRDTTEPDVDGADLLVGVPIDSIVTMSTTFLPHLTALGALDTLVGVDSIAFAFAPDVHARFDSGEITEVGSGPGVDVEQLLALDPDLIMVNSYGGDWDAQPTLKEAGLPVVVSGDWAENSPLGRAEWLLFTALFYDRFDEGLAVYNRTVRDYRRLQVLASSIQRRPSVLVNAPYQGSWAVPGGESYVAQLIEDAGGDYVWADDESTGALFFDIESVFAEAGDADVWINPGTWTSLEQGAAEDERFTEFASFTNGEVYNYNRRIGPGGGNDYFESGALNPHIVLNDLIWVLHPNLVPDYEPYYYQRLE